MLLIFTVIYFFFALTMSAVGVFLVNIDDSPKYIAETRNMVKWVWIWPFMVPVLFVKGLITLIRG
jgi:hypothetical protein